jgi:hypothetical protein
MPAFSSACFTCSWINIVVMFFASRNIRNPKVLRSLLVSESMLSKRQINYALQDPSPNP